MTKEKDLNWQKTSEEYLIKNKWIGVKKASYDLPNGHHVEDYYLVEKPDIVVAVVINEHNQAFLIKEWERGIEKIGYKFPAGSIDQNETPKKAAEREILEEVGASGKTTFLGNSSVEPGLMTNTAHYFFLQTNTSNLTQPTTEDSELFTSEWVPINQINQMIDNNEIQNPFVIVAMRKLEFHLKSQA